MPLTTLWSQERRLWLEGAVAFTEFLAPEALLVCPRYEEIQRGSDALLAIDGAPRYHDVEMTEASAIEAAGSVTLVYRAVGQNEDGGRYRAHCSSTWLKRVDGWRIGLHQQTPLG